MFRDRRNDRPVRRAGRPALRALLLLTIATAFRPAVGAAEVVVYRNDFDARPGTRYPEWSSSRIAFSSRFNPPGSGGVDPPAVTNVESPRGRRRFLGEFGGPRIDPTARTRVRQTVRLKLDKLPKHTEATVSFDPLILRSWDGSSPGYGPDRWSLRVAGGPTLLDTTLSNNPKLDSDKSYQDYPRRGSRPRTGAATAMTLGYGFFGDSSYRLRYTVPHTADSLTLEFSSDLFEGKGTEDESWGLDDVRVSVTTPSAPKPVGGGRP